MTIFDQRHQHVTYQYNANGNINVGVIQNKLELIRELKQLQKELTTAIEYNALDEENALDADYELKKAIMQAEKTIPEKPTLIQHLSKAKELVSSVSGLAGAIGQAIEKVPTIF